MKKIILITGLLSLWMFQLMAQTNINLKIQHKLGDADFAMDQSATNNLDQEFSVTRLEYYISKISLVHDGGIETEIEDRWVLVDPTVITEVDLGIVDLDNLEKIKLHIGVNSEHNHLDPSTFQFGHPLAPKFPSMHWGWAAGYRFVAFEGFGGSNLNQLFQLHSLGDSNYFTTEITLDLTAENGELEIILDADYAKALEDIAVKSGLIVHGETLEAKKCLQNFRDYVFSSASTISSLDDVSEVKAFSLYPNPIDQGKTTVQLNVENLVYKYNLVINSVEGKQIQIFEAVSDQQSLDLSNYASGMYFVNLMKDGQVLNTKKIFIK